MHNFLAKDYISAHFLVVCLIIVLYCCRKLYIIDTDNLHFGGDTMLGKYARAKVVRTIGSVDEAEFTYPLNYGCIYDEDENETDEYAFIMGVDHTVTDGL